MLALAGWLLIGGPMVQSLHEGKGVGTSPVLAGLLEQSQQDRVAAERGVGRVWVRSGRVTDDEWGGPSAFFLGLLTTVVLGAYALSVTRMQELAHAEAEARRGPRPDPSATPGSAPSSSTRPEEPGADGHAFALQPWSLTPRVCGVAVREATIASPPGVTFDAGSGELRWTPTVAEVGLHVIRVEVTAPPTIRGKLALRVRVGFREVAPQRRRHLARLDAGHALAWDDGHPGRSKIAVPGGEIEEVASAEGIGEGGSSPGLVDGDVRVTLRRTVDVVEASFVAATDGRALGSATFVVKSAIDAEARALLFHEHRTLLVPLASGRLALLRYDTSTWNQA